MSDDPCRPVSVSMTIDAPADELFALLCDPSNHPRIDGSGMLQEGPAERISGVGDVFAMGMHNDEMGDYEMANHVLGYDAGRLIAWEPELKAASRTEDQSEVGVRSGVRWSYELQPVGERTTVVTETYDCTSAPDWLRRAVRNGERWVETMTASLTNLRELAQA